MTICIAAICDSWKKVIVVSDRMMTAGDLTVAFEHDIPKITTLSGNCLALTAGPALVHTDLFRSVKSAIHEGATPPISEILTKVKTEYLAIRKRMVEEKYFKVRNFDIEWFNEHQRMLSPEIALRLDHVLETFEFDLAILIAGVDNTGAHIYYVYPPCCSECFDGLGFSSIGTGERHADSTFIAYRYTPTCSLENALYITYEAKRKAEMAVGVGKSTDMAIISEKGTQFIQEEVLKKLKEIYEKKVESETLKKEEINKLLDGLQIVGSDER